MWFDPVVIVCQQLVMRCLLKVMFVMLIVAGAATAVSAQIPTISARQVLLVDAETGTVLFNKNGEESFNPTSMTRLLVAEVVFDALARGEISEESLFRVSEYAWRSGGAPSRTTTMFANVNSQVSVRDLLKGLAIVQANDAAYALAEGLAGDEQAFVRRMNERVGVLGLKQTQIFNLTGLPPRFGEGERIFLENRSSAQDLLALARHIESTYPHYFSLYGSDAFEWNKIFQRNRNPLFRADIGVDGFVSSEIEGSYGLVATAKQGRRRLFLVLNGLDKEKKRSSEAKQLLEWGMTEFETKLVYDADVEVARAQVYGGIESSVGLKTTAPVGVSLPKQPTGLKIHAVYEGPLIAPVEKEKLAGQLVIARGDMILLKSPLVTSDFVEEAGVIKKAADALFELSLGWFRKYL